ncbi:MAG: AzlC family ABC transporter permease [Parvularculales bacterium]
MIKRETHSSGLQAALPIAAAYLPAAFAVGAAASQYGFSPLTGALWSLVMFSGAHQVLMLSALASGTPLILLALFSIIASLRHTLYGIVLVSRISPRPPARAIFAYGLTDEVFATVLNASNHKDAHLSERWLVGLSMTALAVWVVGTSLGIAAGDILHTFSPRTHQALGFALPALFFSFIWSTASRTNLGPMIVAGGLAYLTIVLGYAEFAIPAGAIAALILWGKK